MQGQCVPQQNIFSIIHQALKFNSHLKLLSRLSSKSGNFPFKATSTSFLQNACVSKQYVWLCQRHVIVAQMASSKNKAELAKISSWYKYSFTYFWPALDNSAYVTNSPSSLWMCREQRRCSVLKSSANTKVDHRFLFLFILSTLFSAFSGIKPLSNWI